MCYENEPKSKNQLKKIRARNNEEFNNIPDCVRKMIIDSEFALWLHAEENNIYWIER